MPVAEVLTRGAPARILWCMLSCTPPAGGEVRQVFEEILAANARGETRR